MVPGLVWSRLVFCSAFPRLLLKCVYYLFISRPGFHSANREPTHHHQRWHRSGSLLMMTRGTKLSLCLCEPHPLPNRIINIYSLWLRFVQWQQCPDDDYAATGSLSTLHSLKRFPRHCSAIHNHHPPPIECLFGQSTNNATDSC